MKDLISFLVIFLFLIYFFLQSVQDDINHYRKSSADEIVHVYAQKARQVGYFRQNDINELRKELANRLKINPNDITINVTTTPKYRFDKFNPGELIHYEVILPKKNVIAMNHFFGISNEENSYRPVISGQVHSEVLLP